LPCTATNKILKRELISRGTDPDGRVLWRRDAAGFKAVTDCGL
jgi:fatty-acyl-CoA synthase